MTRTGSDTGIRTVTARGRRPLARDGYGHKGPSPAYAPPRVSLCLDRRLWLTANPISHAAKNVLRGSGIRPLEQLADDEPEGGEDEDARPGARVTAPDARDPDDPGKPGALTS